jgi:hypothetical protein
MDQQPVVIKQSNALAGTALAISIAAVALAICMPFFTKYFSKVGSTVYVSSASNALKIGATGAATSGKKLDVTGASLFTGAIDTTGTITGTSGIAISGSTASTLASSSTSTAAVSLTASAGGITINPANAKGFVCANKGAVTQLVGITTGVELNTPMGAITTVSTTIAAGASSVFTVTCSSCVAITSVVVPSLATYTGGGTPIATVSAVAAGSFNIRISNIHAADALDSTLVINYFIIN